jgi:mannitol/fructose-specific phosphotransferase system IIA component (Ntr-type)
MQILSKLIDQECIMLDRQERSIESIIKTLTDQLTISCPEVAPKILMQKVIAEGFHTVSIGEGCTITHARCPSMKKTLMAVMRLSPELDLKAFDGKNIRLVFLLVGPQSSASFHLKILSRLVRLLHSQPLRETFFTVETADQFYKELENKEQ